MWPSSLFIFSIEFPQSNSKPPQSVCTDVGFRSALVLNSTSEGLRVLTVENGEYITMWVQGEPGIFPVMCCTHFSLQLLNILNILLCVSVICWHILENWLRSSDANIKYAAFLPTATSRKWIYRRGPCTMPVRGQTLTSAAISRRPEWQKYAVICDIF